MLDPASNITIYGYDQDGNLLTTKDPLGHTVTRSYDRAGNEVSVTDGNGETRNYSYTPMGQVSNMTLADGSVEKWTYDGNGNVKSFTNPLNQLISLAYDGDGQLISKTYPNGTGVSFAYDSRERLTSMVDSTGTSTWTYNVDDEVTGYTSPAGSESFTYDGAMRLTSYTDASGKASYSYDRDSNVKTVLSPSNFLALMNYDADDDLITEQYSNNSLPIGAGNGVTEQFQYDPLQRVCATSTISPSNQLLESESYSYDAVGDLIDKFVNNVETTYAYDADNQLISENGNGYSEAFTYDGNHNRTSETLNGAAQTYNYGSADKLNSITEGANTIKSYTYDGAGRTTSITSSAGTTNLSYDYENHLTSITGPNGLSDTFSYNGLGARVSKSGLSGTFSYNRLGAMPTSTLINDGHNEYTAGVMVNGASGSVFNIQDRLASNVSQVDSAGNVGATAQTDGFGNPISSSGPFSGQLGFAGGYGYQTDSDTGLMLLGNRYYDPSTGRFLTQDPAQDGNNWYDYCANDPLAWADPSGKFIWAVLGVALAVYGLAEVAVWGYLYILKLNLKTQIEEMEAKLARMKIARNEYDGTEQRQNTLAWIRMAADAYKTGVETVYGNPTQGVDDTIIPVPAAADTDMLEDSYELKEKLEKLHKVAEVAHETMQGSDSGAGSNSNLNGPVGIGGYSIP